MPVWMISRCIVRENRCGSPSVKGWEDIWRNIPFCSCWFILAVLHPAKSVMIISYEPFAESENVECFTLSFLSISISTSRIIILSFIMKRSDSPRIVPFSAIMQFPEKTRSVEDSPRPAEEYTYEQRHRADC